MATSTKPSNSAQSSSSKADTMVTALTGRLLSAPGSDMASRKRKGEPLELAHTCGGSSGYSADDDQMGKSTLPCYVDFQNKREETKSDSSEKACEDPVASSKRQKTLERDYLAQNVEEELARGGLTMPQIRQNCPRVLPPLCAIDMSRVTLVKSSDFSYLDPMPFNKNARKVSNEMCVQSILSLAEACRSFYAIPQEQKVPDSERCDDQSSTSSVTDTESDEDEEKLTKRKEVVMTMCDALSLCKQPRIVVLSAAPYTVVHVNAAYLHMTGLSSVKLLGQPFQDLIHDNEWIAALNGRSAEEPFSLRQMDQQVIKTRTGSEKAAALKCTVTASPIGVTSERITHFALGLEICEGKARGIEAEGSAPAMTVSG